MADILGEMVVKIVGDSKDLDKTLGKSEKGLNDLGKTGTNTGKTLAKAGALIQTAFVAAIVAGVAKIGKELVSAASDAEETRNKFNVTFSDIMDDADSAATALADGFGLSQQAAEDMLSATGDLLSGFGFTQTAALDLATQTNELAADLASFANVPVKQASEAITKGLLGERESMKLLGIAILDADIQQLAEDKGIVGELDRQQKAMLTLELATKQSKNAIGDFARSQDSFANQTKIAQAAVQDLKVEMGEQLLPIATASISLFGDLARKLADFVEERNNLAELNKVWNEGADSVDELNGAIATTNEKLEEQRAKLQDLILKRDEEGERTRGNVAAKTNERARDIADTERQITALENMIGWLAEERQARQDLADAAAADDQAAIDAANRRIAEIEYRDKIWGLTEEGRRAAIQAEIDELETYKESDEKAQQALAYLREELAGLTDDTETLTEYTGAWSDLAQAAYNKYQSDAQLAKQATKDVSAEIEVLAEKTFDWTTILTTGLESSLAGFSDLGAALVNGEDGWNALGKASLGALAEILRGIGAQLASLSALAIVEAILGNVAAAPGTGIAIAGAAAAYTAAGILDATANNFAEGGIVMPSPGGTIARVAEAGQPEVIFPLDKLEAMMGGKIGGNTFVYRPLIGTGSEADMRLAARKFYSYLDAEGQRRGGV